MYLGLGFFLFAFTLISLTLVLKQSVGRKIDLLDSLFLPVLLVSSVPFFSQNQFLNSVSFLVFICSYYLLTIKVFFTSELKDFNFINSFLFPAKFIFLNIKCLFSFSKFNNKLVASEKKSSFLSSLFWGIILAIPVLAIYILLFSTSDTEFYKIIDPKFLLNNINTFIFFTIFFVIFTLNFIVFFRSKENLFSYKTQLRVSLPVTTIITVLSLVNVVFLTFVYTQFVYLFGNRDKVVEIGLNYAEYSKQGLAELLVAMTFSIFIILSVKLLSKNFNRANLLINTSLLALVVLNIIVLASTVHRLNLLVSGYLLSEKRFFTYVLLIFIAIILIYFVLGIVNDLLNGFRNKIIKFNLFEYTFPFCYFLAISMVFCVALINPNKYIAEFNIAKQTALENTARLAREGIFQEPIDSVFLISLGMEAIEPLMNYPNLDVEYHKCEMASYKAKEINRGRDLATITLRNLTEGYSKKNSILSEYLVEWENETYLHPMCLKDRYFDNQLPDVDVTSADYFKGKKQSYSVLPAQTVGVEMRYLLENNNYNNSFTGKKSLLKGQNPEGTKLENGYLVYTPSKGDGGKTINFAVEERSGSLVRLHFYQTRVREKAVESDQVVFLPSNANNVSSEESTKFVYTDPNNITAKDLKFYGFAEIKYSFKNTKLLNKIVIQYNGGLISNANYLYSDPYLSLFVVDDFGDQVEMSVDEFFTDYEEGSQIVYVCHSIVGCYGNEFALTIYDFAKAADNTFYPIDVELFTEEL